MTSECTFFVALTTCSALSETQVKRKGDAGEALQAVPWLHEKRVPGHRDAFSNGLHPYLRPTIVSGVL